MSLAAETCGHVRFPTHTDTWYNGEPLHCGDLPAGDTSFWDVYRKVRHSALRPLCWLTPARTARRGAPVL